MTDSLKECIELLERLRDTYLNNHQTERALITEVVERAKGTEKPVPKEEPEEPKHAKKKHR